MILVAAHLQLTLVTPTLVGQYLVSEFTIEREESFQPFFILSLSRADVFLNYQHFSFQFYSHGAVNRIPQTYAS